MIDDEAEAPSAIPLSSAMSQIPVDALMSLAAAPLASPTVTAPPLCVSVFRLRNVVVPPIVRPETAAAPESVSMRELPLRVTPARELAPVNVRFPPERVSVAPAPAEKVCA